MRVEPLDVQLMSLRCVVRRGLDLDAKRWMLHPEPRDLAAQHRPLGSERASGNRDDTPATRPLVARLEANCAVRDTQQRDTQRDTRAGAAQYHDSECARGGCTRG